MLDKAIQYASLWFDGKVDKAGKPYILHLIRVMLSVDQNDEELMQIAVLHDVLEDTPVTIRELEDMGFSVRVLSGIDHITKHKGQDYDEYLSQVCINIDSVKVKLADLKDNMDLSRIKNMTDKDWDRRLKYMNAEVRLLRHLETIQPKKNRFQQKMDDAMEAARKGHGLS